MMSRRGTVVVNYDAVPRDLDHAALRPLVLLRNSGFEVHAVSRAERAERHEIGGVTSWVEPGVATVWRRVAALRPELLFVEAAAYGVLLGPLARRSWIRNPQPASGRAGRMLQRAVFPSFDAVTLTVPEVMSEWEPRDGRAVDLPYPVDLELWRRPTPPEEGFWRSRGIEPPSGPVIVSNAALIRHKRPAELLEAVAPLLRREQGSMLVFVGNPHPEPDTVERLKATRDALGVGDRVLIPGWMSHEEIREVLAWASVSVINSISETQCMAIYESLAAGVPVLIPAIPHLTTQFPSLPSHSDGDELLANVERLLADPEIGMAAIARSAERVQWADVRRHDAEFFATLSRLLGRQVDAGSA